MIPQALRSAAQFGWCAETIYDIHAPLSFAFAGEVIEDHRRFYAFDDIDVLRRRYSDDRTVVELKDAGAGSQVGTGSRRSIRDIARTSSSPVRFGEYLTRIADWRDAERVLELGTNLGIGTCHLAAGMKSGGRLVSIDADDTLAAFAKTAVQETVPFADVQIAVGTFRDQLPGILSELGRVDLAFVDGHHAEQPTVDYYELIRAYCHEDSVLIFDDIHWSSGMERAWDRIRRRPEVTLSLDLYRWGVIFFDTKIRSPQHHALVPWTWKPWHMGFFRSRR